MDAEGYRQLFEDLGIYTESEPGRCSQRAERTKVLRRHNRSLRLYFDHNEEIGGVYFTGRASDRDRFNTDELWEERPGPWRTRGPEWICIIPRQGLERAAFRDFLSRL